MSFIDYVIVGLFQVALLVLGFALSKRAGRSTDEFILAGRKLPWWLAGTSIAATGLNASTMLCDSRKIRQDGIAGVWFTWRAVIGLLIGTIWFTRLWRRARFTTQMEFYEARYSGWPATFARIYDSIVYGVILACVWASVGVVGMKKIADVLFNLPEAVNILGYAVPADLLVIAGLIIITTIYSVASGVYGVVWTDFIEFIIAMACSYTLLFFVYREVGWNTGLRESLENFDSHSQGTQMLALLPEFGPILIFMLFIGPIFGQGGYNPHTQRLLCVKNEREVIFTSLYNAIVNFVFKSWPYYICGLCGIFIISDSFLLENYGGITTPEGSIIPDYEKVFPALIAKFLPPGFVGLMMAGFMSAFMSSFDTNIHNSACIFLNDMYRPYLKKGASEKHYVRTTRIYMVIITICAAAIGLIVDDVLYITMIAFTLMGSVGWIKFLRFVWWRANGKAEVAAQITSLFMTSFFLSPLGAKCTVTWMRTFNMSGNDAFFFIRLIFLVGCSTTVALLVVFLFPPEPMDKLCAFYRRVRPFGFWGPVVKACGLENEKKESLILLVILTISCIGAVFGLIFASLGLLLAMWWITGISTMISVFGFIVTAIGIKKLYPKPVV